MLTQQLNLFKPFEDNGDRYIISVCGHPWDDKEKNIATNNLLNVRVFLDKNEAFKYLKSLNYTLRYTRVKSKSMDKPMLAIQTAKVRKMSDGEKRLLGLQAHP